jgi:flavin reductase (DIM6/NTAB) family NADH-FMN oxidoreductase RutF
MTVLPADTAVFDARGFRDTLGRYATGVALVIASGPDGAVAGMTINSFASVSLDPPLVLWSMRSDTASAQVFRDAAGFTVSILGAGHEAVARRCARTDGEKLDGLELAYAPSGVPRLDDAMAWFDCATWAVYPGGDHDIFVGHVRDFGARPGATLTFQDGRFRSSDA